MTINGNKCKCLAELVGLQYVTYTHRSIGDAEKGKEHIIIPFGHELANHRLCVLCCFGLSGDMWKRC